jgi:hypothetical protein
MYFVGKFPNFVRTPQLKETLKNYMHAFTQGIDNTRTKDHVDEAVENYEAILRDRGCPDGPERDRVSLAYDVWKKSQTFSKSGRFDPKYLLVINDISKT